MRGQNYAHIERQIIEAGPCTNPVQRVLHKSTLLKAIAQCFYVSIIPVKTLSNIAPHLQNCTDLPLREGLLGWRLGNGVGHRIEGKAIINHILCETDHALTNMTLSPKAMGRFCRHNLHQLILPAIIMRQGHTVAKCGAWSPPGLFVPRFLITGLLFQLSPGHLSHADCHLGSFSGGLAVTFPCPSVTLF